MRVSREELVAHVQRWSKSPLHAGSEWVPGFVYHFSDVTNAANILRDGEVLSRNEAVRRGAMQNDNAAAAVIAATTAAHRDFARLYFRPRTPTQYHNEGIRPPAYRGLDGAHCPVPVFLAFDLVETLSIPGVLFSDGNMAAGQVRFSDDAALFGAIPFELVYHEGYFDEVLRARRVVFHRQAEVLAPTALGLSTLRWIGCRSNAERESLLFLLGEERAKWERLIAVATGRLFYKRGCCVESVAVDDGAIQVTLHIPSSWSLRVRFELRSDSSGKLWRWSHDSWNSPVLRLTVRDLEPGVMRLHIEDCLAYVSRVQLADVPF